MRILIFGASGMLGRTLFKFLSNDDTFHVFGTVRTATVHQNIIPHVSVESIDSLSKAFEIAKPHAVINCIGLVKQLSDGNVPLKAIAINSQLPHQLSALCKPTQTRLIQISTDCVFSGAKGNYDEEDIPDAKDIYGRSKLLGEVLDAHALTLRTSIIGHDQSSQKSLLEWFLSQKEQTKGYTRAIFSGFPTIELAKIIKQILCQHQSLTGIYHVASQPINKFDLLSLIAKIYQKTIQIIPDETLTIDRSLNGSRFTQATGYTAPSWPELIQVMYACEK